MAMAARGGNSFGGERRQRLVAGTAALAKKRTMDSLCVSHALRSRRLALGRGERAGLGLG